MHRCIGSRSSTKLRAQKSIFQVRLVNMRSRLRKLRWSIAPELRSRYNSTICNQLLRELPVKNFSHIGVYLSFDGEVDLSAFIRVAQQRGQNLYAPRLLDKTDKRMYFTKIDAMGLQENHYGILQSTALSPAIATAQLQVIVAPVVGFDRYCNRIGMGGGYYDRVFAKIKQAHNKMRLIGVAFQVQLCKNIEPKSWDVPLEQIITEQCNFNRNTE